MLYGVVWKFSTEEGRRILIGHPETLDGMDTVAKAQDDGRQILADLPPHDSERFTPLSVVELNEEMIEALNACDLVEVGDLMFVDAADLDFWSANDWWSK